MYISSFLTNFLKKDDDTFNKIDNSLPRKCWLNILEYLQKDEEINALQLVSKEMQHIASLTEAGKKYYQRKRIFFNTYEKIKAISQQDNNYARFFVSHSKAQVTMIKDQLNTPSNTFSLTVYFDNSLRSNEEKAYLAQQLGTGGSSFFSSPQIYSISCRNHPTRYFHQKRHGLTSPYSNESVDDILRDMDQHANLHSPIYNHAILIFTIDAAESNRFIQKLAESKTKHPSKMPFIIIISLNPLIKVEDFHHPILKLFSILPSYREKLADAFFLNNIHPCLWTNTSYRYDYYYRGKMENIKKEIKNLLENLVNIKESLQTNQLMNSQ